MSKTQTTEAEELRRRIERTTKYLESIRALYSPGQAVHVVTTAAILSLTTKAVSQ